MNYTETIKQYLVELDYTITHEKEDEGILIIEKEEYGVKNLVLGITPPVLILEQYIFKIDQPSAEIFQSLLIKNREIIHGAFVLDDSGKKVIFRDTLQIETLDIEELEASLNSLSLLMSEYANEIIKFSKY
ncbi:YbjN domain-containing protein [Brumimicrobium mesophilum]|uniref:YbjN domain-containing protein n=1 Tax=Brumimicrobium mesophilum TaxID=392717 RepID=UPI000D143B0A|nr:YbjN domain-containing protein [Brumimicrobium mesophilum]